MNQKIIEDILIAIEESLEKFDGKDEIAVIEVIDTVFNTAEKVLENTTEEVTEEMRVATSAMCHFYLADLSNSGSIFVSLDNLKKEYLPSDSEEITQ